METRETHRQPGIIVYCCGLATSALALWGVHVLNQNGVNVMGSYVNGIIPMGALFVGVASGLGYALGARFLHLKPSKAFVWGMISTGLLDYVATQYLTYSSLLEHYQVTSDHYSFFRYIQDECEHMAFKSSGSSEAGTPLGVAGYFFKSLEMAGYALGVMGPSMVIHNMPYCAGCQLYLKTHLVAHIPGSALWPEVKKLKKQARIEALQKAVEEVQKKAALLMECVASAPFAETESLLNVLDKTAAKDRAGRVIVRLSKCPNCETHHLAFTLHSFAANKKPVVTTLRNIDKPASIASAVSV